MAIRIGNARVGISSTSGGGSSSPVGGLAAISTLLGDWKVTTSNGDEWLRTGIVENDWESYPDVDPGIYQVTTPFDYNEFVDTERQNTSADRYNRAIGVVNDELWVFNNHTDIIFCYDLETRVLQRSVNPSGIGVVVGIAQNSQGIWLMDSAGTLHKVDDNLNELGETYAMGSMISTPIGLTVKDDVLLSVSQTTDSIHEIASDFLSTTEHNISASISNAALAITWDGTHFLVSSQTAGDVHNVFRYDAAFEFVDKVDILEFLESTSTNVYIYGLTSHNGVNYYSQYASYLSAVTRSTTDFKMIGAHYVSENNASLKFCWKAPYFYGVYNGTVERYDENWEYVDSLSFTGYVGNVNGVTSDGDNFYVGTSSYYLHKYDADWNLLLSSNLGNAFSSITDLGFSSGHLLVSSNYSLSPGVYRYNPDDLSYVDNPITDKITEVTEFDGFMFVIEQADYKIRRYSTDGSTKIDGGHQITKDEGSSTVAINPVNGIFSNGTQMYGAGVKGCAIEINLGLAVGDMNQSVDYNGNVLYRKIKNGTN